MKFSDWFYNEYIKWRGDTRRTYSDFAEWLGLSQPVVSMYMNGDNKMPSVETIRIIEKRLPSIHGVLFTAAPNVPADMAERIKQAIVEAFEECERQNITPTSPEGSKLMDSILSKHGIHSKSKT